MKENKDCKIVQDLLPNYIEKLTSEETNSHIEEHLRDCEDCRKTLESMKKDLELNSKKRDGREVKYIKKFKNKMRLLKAIILLILVIFVIVTGRKIIILSNLSDKAESYVTCTNYHRITYSYDQGNYTKSEIYSLENKKKIIMTKLTDEGRTITTMLATKIGEDEWGADRYLTDIYIETETGKTAKLNQDFGISVDPQNTFYTENWWQLVICSIPASIRTTTFNGNECYYISNFQGPYMHPSKGAYINKDTGLLISTIASEYEDSIGTRGRWPAGEYVYEFNTVTEDDFIEPDISEYEIEE